MERPLDRCIDEIFNTPGVTGVLCTDSKGLCLTSKGVLNEQCAGAFSLIAGQAAHLEPGNSLPVVQLETDNCHIMISQKGDITLVVAKTPVPIENGQ